MELKEIKEIYKKVEETLQNIVIKLFKSKK
jgi:hypothetical protein